MQNEAAKNRLVIQLPVELSRQSHAIIRTVRRLFDLDADPLAIEATLSTDPLMRELVTRYPGIRVPGAWDGFELLLRVIVGQQISVAGATTIMRRLVDRIGVSAEAVAGSTADAIAAVGLPKKRAATIYAAAAMVRDGGLDLEESDPAIFYERLVQLPGIGPWTAEYARMRILHWPDAFPAGDLGVQKALARGGRKLSEKEAAALSQAWRPWRSYATMLLWRLLHNQGG